MARKRVQVILTVCFLTVIVPAFSVDLEPLHLVKRDDMEENSTSTTTNTTTATMRTTAIPNTINNNIDNDHKEKWRYSGPKYTPNEFARQLKELLERDRPGRADAVASPRGLGLDQDGFRSFLVNLVWLADRAPDHLKGVDILQVGDRVAKPGPRQGAQNNRCLKNPIRLLRFLVEVREVFRDLIGNDDDDDDDSQTDDHDSDSKADDLDNSDSHNRNDEESDDDCNGTTDDIRPSTDANANVDAQASGSPLLPTTDSVADIVTKMTADHTDVNHGEPHLIKSGYGNDHNPHATAFVDFAAYGGDDIDVSSDDMWPFSLVKRDVYGRDDVREERTNAKRSCDDDDGVSYKWLEGIDMEDIFEKLSEKSLECIMAFLNDEDTAVLCRQFSDQSSRVFSAFIRSGADCSVHLHDTDSYTIARERERHRRASVLTGNSGNWKDGHFRSSRSDTLSRTVEQDQDDHPVDLPHHERGNRGVVKSISGTVVEHHDNYPGDLSHHVNSVSSSTVLEHHDDQPVDLYHHEMGNSDGLKTISKALVEHQNDPPVDLHRREMGNSGAFRTVSRTFVEHHSNPLEGLHHHENRVSSLSERISSSVVEQQDDQPMHHHESGESNAFQGISNAVGKHPNDQHVDVHHHEGGVNGMEGSRLKGSTGYYQRTSASITGRGQNQPVGHYHSSVRSWRENHIQQPNEHFHGSFSQSSASSAEHHGNAHDGSYDSASPSQTDYDMSQGQGNFNGELQNNARPDNLQQISSDRSISAVFDDGHNELSQSYQQNSGGMHNSGNDKETSHFLSMRSGSRSRAVTEAHDGRYPTHQVQTQSDVIIEDGSHKPTKIHHAMSGTWVEQDPNPFRQNPFMGPTVSVNGANDPRSRVQNSHGMIMTHRSKPTQNRFSDSMTNFGSEGHQSSYFRQSRNTSNSMIESRNGYPSRMYQSRSDSVLEGRDGLRPRHFQRHFAAMFEDPGERHAGHNHPNHDSVFEHQMDHQSHHFRSPLNSASDDFHVPFQNRRRSDFMDPDRQVPNHHSNHNGLMRLGNAVRPRHSQDQNIDGSEFGPRDDFFGSGMTLREDFFDSGYRGLNDVFAENLEAAHQRVLLNRMLLKPLQDWTRQDLQSAIRLASDVIDDDFLEGLPDDIFHQNLDLLGSLASKEGGSKDYGKDVRKKIAKGDPAQYTASGITKLGKDLLDLGTKDLKKFTADALLDADIDKVFKEEDKYEDFDGKDYDQGRKQSRRLAVGRRMKDGDISQSDKLGKVVRFLYDDMNFLGSTSPDELLSAVSSFSSLNLSPDDAASLFKRMSLSKNFPDPSAFTKDNVNQMRNVLSGMGLSKLKELPEDVVKESLKDLKEVSFGESQARELLKDIGDKAETLTAEKMRDLGKLAKGLTPQDIEKMDSKVVTDALDDIGKVDFSAVQKKALIYKAVKGGRPKAVSKLMSIPKMARVLDVHKIDAVSDDEVDKSLGNISKIRWRLPQAMAIIKKVRNARKGPLLATDLPALGKLVRGLTPAELGVMGTGAKEVNGMAAILCNEHHLLTSAQVDKMVNLIEEKDRLKELEEVIANAAFVKQTGCFLSYLRPELWTTMQFPDKALEEYLPVLSSMATKKMSRDQITSVAKKMLPLVKTETGVEAVEMDYLKIKYMGEFVVGLTPKKLTQLNGKAILQSMPLLGTLPFDRSQAKVLLNKITEADSEWKCEATVVADVGPLLQFADQSLLSGICEEALASSASVLEKRMERRQKRLEEKRKEGLWREDMEKPPEKQISYGLSDITIKGERATEDKSGRKQLARRVLKAAASAKFSTDSSSGNSIGRWRFRRDNIAAVELTCNVLRLMRNDVVNVPVSQIVGLVENEFRDCLEFLGGFSDWDDDALYSLYNRFIRLYGEANAWTNEDIRQAGVLITRAPAPVLGQTNITGVDALYSIGRHGRLSEEQLEAGFARWLELQNSSDIETVTAGEFSGMSEFVCGLTLDNIKALNIDVIRDSLDVIGEVRSCSTEKITEYLMRAKEAFDQNVANWEPSIVGEAGRLIGALQSSDIVQLTDEQIAAIPPTAISVFPTDFFKTMSNVQLGYLSSNQANSLTLDQFNELNQEQKKIVSAKMTTLAPGKPRPPPDGATATPVESNGVAVRWSLPLLVAAIIVPFLGC